MKKIITNLNLLNLVVIIFLLFLPYYIFQGKFYLGGDDTRLFYTYPAEFIRNVSFFSWHNVSSLGMNSSNQAILPFMSIWLILDKVFPKGVFLTYLAFSLPLIVGFLFFQKAVREIFEINIKYNFEIFLGSLFYVLSPILIINQLFIFLTAIWLIGLIPLNIFLFLRYVRTSNFKYVFLGAIACMFFLGILYLVPWILGFLFPAFLGLLIISFYFSLSQKLNFIKRLIIYLGFIVLTQAYGILTFVASFFSLDSSSFSQKLVSKGFLDTFSSTVLTTGTGNIFYPLLNLFHRQIAMDFNWKLLNEFLNFYDYTYILNTLYIAVVVLGFVNFKKFFPKNIKITYIYILISFIFSLYFFTVNIGPLKDFFLILGKLPGFLMFRNFYDKFALGYVLFYSLLITASLVVIKQKFPKKYPYIAVLFLFVVIINFLPVKSTINSPLWRTQSVYRVIKIPNEYLNFMKDVKREVPPTNNILSIPFGTSIYTVIKDENSDNVFVGSSPVRIFSGVNDISGHYSFNYSEEANTIDSMINNREYEKFNEVLNKYNINYAIITKNIPEQVMNTWVYDEKMTSKQDGNFKKAILGPKILISSNGNYELYKTNSTNSLILGENIYFQKISPVKYKILIKNLNKTQEFIFNDSYHSDWRIYPSGNENGWCKNPKLLNKERNINECEAEHTLFEKIDLGYFFNKDSFRNSHSIHNRFSNKWTVDPAVVAREFPMGTYSKNNDGSMNVSFVLYFIPQDYFYYGVIISVTTLLSGAFYVIKKRKK